MKQNKKSKRKILYLSLGTPTPQDKTILSFWWDFEDQNRSRFMKNGSFDVDKWEASKTHIAVAPGANARSAWKNAWRIARTISRNNLCGYAFIDGAAHIDGEPLPLPASVWGWDGVPEACHARP